MNTRYIEKEAADIPACAVPLSVPALTTDEREAERVLTICNSCRYCEGFCAVFPAMTRRLDFVKQDIHYLANLCHNCGACLHACQYADPHEFDVNIPRTLAQVRKTTYVEYAWPLGFGRLYEKNALTVALALAGGLAAFLVLAVAMNGSLLHEPLQGNFYAIFPHNLLVAIFGIVFLFAILALGIGVSRFWRTTSDAKGSRSVDSSSAALEATTDVLTLTYLDGGHGEGCNESDNRYTLKRRIYHHFTFYGFLLCFAATSVGTLYHYVFGWYAPYPYLSLPVILGTLGGAGLLIGPAGLFMLNMNRHPDHGDASQRGMDRGFIALLFLTSLTGLLLLVLRETQWMGLLLAIHLGVVMAFFLTMPYGKFAHGIFRSAALLKNAIEKRMPSNTGLSAD